VISDQYLAGLIDGEGAVTILHYRSESRFRSHISVLVTMCDREPLDAIATRFGTRVLTLPRRNSRWRTAYRWQSQGVAAENLLRAILPYLIVKRQQAELALAFRDTLTAEGGRTKITAETMHLRAALAAEIHRLNERGIAA
jgi:hypothetical protein